MITNCPACRNELRVQDEFLGRKVRCPTCNAIFEAGTTPPTEAPQPDAPRAPAQEEIVDYDPSADPRAQRRRQFDDYDDQPRRRGERPSKAQAIAIMTLIGGILATMLGLGIAMGSMGWCCLWPGTYYSLVVGIMAIVKGSQLLGQDDWRQPAPRSIAIMQIINIINGDMTNCVLGILTLVFLNEPDVRRYYRG